MEQDNGDNSGKKARHLRQKVKELDVKIARLSDDLAKTQKIKEGLEAKNASLTRDIEIFQKERTAYAQTLAQLQNAKDAEIKELYLKIEILKKSCELLGNQLAEKNAEMADRENQLMESEKEYEDEILKLKSVITEKQNMLSRLEKFEESLLRKIREIQDELDQTWFWQTKSIFQNFIGWIHQNIVYHFGPEKSKKSK